MKVLYHHRIASKDGQYVHVAEIIASLRKLGTEILVVAPQLAEQQRFGGEVGIVAKLKKNLPRVVYEILELGYSVLDFFKIAAAIVRFKPDVIYERCALFLPSGVVAAKLFRVPLILETNSPLFDERSKYGGLGLPWVARWTERYVWRNAGAVLPVTHVLARRMEKEGVDPARITVLANGINQEQFAVETNPKAIPAFAADRVTVGFVGFCREWHELDKLVALIAEDESKKLCLLIVGDGPVIPALKEQVARLGCEHRVQFSGLVERKDMPAWLAAIDIAIQPAVVPYASPLKLIEYLATGKAIVAPSQDNIRELLEHEKNALLFTEGDTRGLLDAIRRLSKDEALRKRLAGAARATIADKELLWDANGRKILAIAEHLRAR